MELPYIGKVLLVDLTLGTHQELEIPDEVYEQYLSGTGLAAYLLFDLIPAGADPLGPDNVLGFVTGLLTGSGSLFTGRWMAVGKSPLTGTWGEANGGGYLSIALKKCGYDGIFFRGISSKPVYLSLLNGEVRLEDAAEIWGLDTIETEARLIQQYSAYRPAVAAIGPAGERLSLISSISHDEGRMAARSGLGAVMGSKKLKAIVLSGSKKIGCADRKTMKALSKNCAERVRRTFPLPGGWFLLLFGWLLRIIPFTLRLDGIITLHLFKKWGTSSLNRLSVEWGDAPIKNWKGTYHNYPAKFSREIDPDRLLNLENKKYACYSCPLACGGRCQTPDGKEFHKPEYETVMALGGLLLISDLQAIQGINDRLIRAGMDSISTGGVIAYAIECYEKGLLTCEQTGGLDLSWGNTEAIIVLVEKMISREGVGELLADGVRKAVERLGGVAEEGAIHAGGQELCMHDTRLDPGYALHAAVEPVPGRHAYGSYGYYNMYQLWRKVKHLPVPPLISSKESLYSVDERTGIQAAANSSYSQIFNGTGMCMLGALMGAHRLPIFEWINAAAGWNKSPEEYLENGRRIQTIRQLFNLRHGIDPTQIMVSRRALGMPRQETSTSRGRSVDLAGLRRVYWAAIGWDENSGIPTPKTIQELGLDKFTPLGFSTPDNCR